MGSLSDLPPEVLETICVKISSAQLLKLWLLGSRLLQAKLSATSIERIHLDDENLYSVSRWPAFITELRKVKHVSVLRGFARLFWCPHSALSWYTYMESELNKFPADLESLHLTCYELNEHAKSLGSAWQPLDFFRRFFPRLNSLTCYNQTSITEKRHLGWQSLTILRPMDAPTVFPDTQVTATRFQSRFHYDQLWVALNPAIISDLPSTLSHLSLPHHRLGHTSADALATQLPKLVSLTLASAPFACFNKLPSRLVSLELLNISFADDTQHPNDWTQDFPTTLEKLLLRLPYQRYETVMDFRYLYLLKALQLYVSDWNLAIKQLSQVLLPNKLEMLEVEFTTIRPYTYPSTLRHMVIHSFIGNLKAPNTTVTEPCSFRRFYEQIVEILAFPPSMRTMTLYLPSNDSTEAMNYAGVVERVRHAVRIPELDRLEIGGPPPAVHSLLPLFAGVKTLIWSLDLSFDIDYLPRTSSILWKDQFIGAIPSSVTSLTLREGHPSHTLLPRMLSHKPWTPSLMPNLLVELLPARDPENAYQKASPSAQICTDSRSRPPTVASHLRHLSILNSSFNQGFHAIGQEGFEWLSQFENLESLHLDWNLVKDLSNLQRGTTQTPISAKQAFSLLPPRIKSFTLTGRSDVSREALAALPPSCYSVSLPRSALRSKDAHLGYVLYPSTTAQMDSTCAV